MKKFVCSFVAIVLCVFLIFMFAGCGGATGPTASMTPPDNSGNGGGSGGGGGSTTSLMRQVALVSHFTPELTAPQGGVSLQGVDPTTGNLTQLPTNIGILGGGGVTVNPAGTFLVQVEITDLASWAVQSDGSLKQAFKLSPNPAGLPSATFTDGDREGILMHPSGQFFYYSVFTKGIAGFRLDSNGTITKLSSAPFPPDNPLVAMHPSGKFMFGDAIIGQAQGGGVGQHAIVTYNIDSATGAVSVAGQTLVGGPHSSIRVAEAHSGKFLFISDDALSSIYTYSVNQATGLLTLASTATIAPQSPATLAVNSSDTLLYARAGSSAGRQILGFSISSDGSLHAVNSGNPVLTDPSGATIGNHIGVDLTGKFFYTAVATRSAIQVSGFRINSDGTLSPNSTTSIPISGVAVSGLGFANFKQ